MTRVAVDAMGGDHAPREVVRGAVAAVREFGLTVVLVGQPEVIRGCLRDEGADLPIVPASDVIAMDEHPSQAVRSRPDASLVVGMRLVRDGEADAFLSAGNSGAIMAAALFQLGRIEGIARPAIGSIFPTIKGQRAILVDAGANASCKPSYLLDFAHLGSAYMERVYGIAHPTIGLISNGEEPTKGSPLVLEAHQLLVASDLNFIGNVEGKDVVGHAADVYVTDGFTGNVMVKLAEGVAAHIVQLLKEELRSRWQYRLAAAVAMPAFQRVARRLDHAEYGGGPLLGVNGAVLIAHGRADQRAIKNAIRAVSEMASQDVVGAVRAHLGGRLTTGFRQRLTKGFRHGTS